MRQWHGHIEGLSPLVAEVRQAILRRMGSKPPHLVILYGSEARGEATHESDIDLLVVLDEIDQTAEQAVRDAVYDVMWNDDFSRLISTFVLSRHQFEEQQRKGYSFARNVAEDGVILWQAA